MNIDNKRLIIVQQKTKKTEAPQYILIARNLGLLFLFHVLFSISHINNVSSIISRVFVYIIYY